MEDWKKYTKCYKGEEENPYTDDVHFRWWIMESYYFPGAIEYPEERKEWETGERYKQFIKDFPEVRIMLNKQEPITRGFLAKTALEAYSHTLCDVRLFIKEYIDL